MKETPEFEKVFEIEHCLDAKRYKIRVRGTDAGVYAVGETPFYFVFDAQETVFMAAADGVMSVRIISKKRKQAPRILKFEGVAK